MATTLSLRRLWTIYKRTAVPRGLSKRECGQHSVGVLQRRPRSPKGPGLPDRARRVRGAARDDQAARATDREDAIAAPAGEKPLTPKPRKAPAFLTPMAALAVKKLPEGDEWLYELKWDGYRALLIKDGEDVEIRSRNDKDLTAMYPGIAAAVRRQKIKQIVLDGELVALGEDGRPSFQALQHRSSHQKHQIVFYAFDVLHADGRDLTGERLEVRRARLPALVSTDAVLRLSQDLPGTAADIVRGSSSRRRRGCDRQTQELHVSTWRAFQRLGEIEARTTAGICDRRLSARWHERSRCVAGRILRGQGATLRRKGARGSRPTCSSRASRQAEAAAGPRLSICQSSGHGCRAMGRRNRR